MGAYDSLAFSYDELTRDVPYERFADFHERIFGLYGKKPALVLDFACGTGTETCILAERGYEMIGADASPEMLAVAYEKAAELPEGIARPLFLCQKMEELDLYGTVGAVICTLDGLNYAPAGRLEEIFCRVRLFLEPGGVFVFDVNTPLKLRSLDGQIFLDETDDAYCVWRAEWDEKLCACRYWLDVFALTGDLWERGGEEHIEYAHEPAYLTALLEKLGFTDTRVFGELRLEAPGDDEQRVFIAARRGQNGQNC